MPNPLDTLPRRIHRLPPISTDLPLLSRSSSESSSSSSSSNNPNTTPKTSPSTGIPHNSFNVLCMHDFESPDPIHLSFRKDEELIIIKQEYSGWWAAMRPHGDRIGWIPSSFVLPLKSSETVVHSDETRAPYPYGSFSDAPLSAVHDAWVPVSEDYAALFFRLATPTDVVLQSSIST